MNWHSMGYASRHLALELENQWQLGEDMSLYALMSDYGRCHFAQACPPRPPWLSLAARIHCQISAEDWIENSPHCHELA
eukprot:5497065-Amphidinium_carterae.1